MNVGSGMLCCVGYGNSYSCVRILYVEINYKRIEQICSHIEIS